MVLLRTAMLKFMHTRCFGGCIGCTDSHHAEPEVIDMACPNEDFLHLKDFTANEADLMPMLPEEVVFHRIENFHCRNLTIFDTTPIAVRKFADLTKELTTIKEPIAIELPPTLPFDTVNCHPSIDSQVPSLSDIDIRSESTSPGIEHGTKQVSMDEACYRLADRIYEIEKSKMKGRHLHADNITETPPLNDSSCSTVCTSLRGFEDAACVRHDGYDIMAHCHMSRLIDDCEDRNRDPVVDREHNSSHSKLLNSCQQSMQMTPALGQVFVPSASENTPDRNIAAFPFNHDIPTGVNDRSNLHHVSQYHTDPPIEFFDPFDDENDVSALPWSLGSRMWSLVVRGSSLPYYQDSIDISIEGTVSSFYSKEELRVLRQTFEHLPRSEVASIVESTIKMLNR